jgi:3-oxoacyl-[acyl-carrier-protein] synthase II
MSRRVVITGMGCVTPLGAGVETFWQALLRGESGIRRTEVFDASTFPTTFSAQVKGFQFPPRLARSGRHVHAGRHTQWALTAALEAWQGSGLEGSRAHDPLRTGIYLGSGEGSLDFDNFNGLLVDAWTAGGKLDTARWGVLAFQRMNVHREQEQESHMAVSHLAAEFGVRGPAFNVLTACAASTQAIGEAAMIIRRGDAEVMISGGAHSMIHPYGVTGFCRLTALSRRNDDPATASRPFNRTRDGFVLGEGSSIMILEEYEFARRRGARMLAEIIGYGSSADAFRITDQDPEGEGAVSAMRAALADAGIRPDQVDYISAHGTGTTQNDSVETRAVKAVFAPRPPPISSIKGSVGHLIAAAGATELITCVLAIRDQVLPPTANLTTPDPELDLDYVPVKPRPAKVETCLSNSFGFGGQNDSLVVTRAK